MRENTKTSLKTGVAILTISGLAMGGIAIAQTNEDPPPPDSETEGTERPARGSKRGFCKRGFHFVEAISELTGLSPQELIEELQAGSTIAQVAEANGSSGAAAVDALVAQLTERLDQAVVDEKLTQEEADDKLAEATERFEELVDAENPSPARRGGGDFGSRGFGGDHTEAIADVLQLSVDDLQAARQDGQSLGDLAEQQGVAIDDLVAVLIAPLTERLDTAVADEKLTQDEADEKLADATDRITEGIESGDGFDPRGPGRRFGRRGFGPRGPGGPGFGPGSDAPVEEIVNA